MPDGEAFPEDYAWSEDGAALYDTSDFEDDEEDFGGIKLMARIDTGALGLGLSEDGQQRVLFDETSDEPMLTSNLEIEFLKSPLHTL